MSEILHVFVGVEEVVKAANIRLRSSPYILLVRPAIKYPYETLTLGRC